MERKKEGIGLTLCLLLVLTEPGYGFSIVEGPSNSTVLLGSVASFNCTVSQGWELLIWLLHGLPVLSVVAPEKVITSYPEKYKQQGYRNGPEFRSELMIQNVQLNDSGQIECSIQKTENKYAFLSVQVNGSLNIKYSNLTVRKNQTIEIVCEAVDWAPAPHITWTVNNVSVNNSRYFTNASQESNGLYYEESSLTLTPLINSTVTCLAVIQALSEPQYTTVTFIVYDPPPIDSDKNEDNWRLQTILAIVLPVVGLLLLILIILLIVYCCKKRKAPNYQKEMRNVSGKKTANRNLEISRQSGNDNFGYDPEAKKDLGQMKRFPSFNLDHSNFYDSAQELAVNSASKVPSDGYDRELSSRTMAYPVNPRKIRNMTHV